MYSVKVSKPELDDNGFRISCTINIIDIIVIVVALKFKCMHESYTNTI